MSKLNELFVETINKAVKSADVMSDLNQKPIAYASIAQALATYLQSSNTISNTSSNILDNTFSNVSEEQAQIQTDKVTELMTEVPCDKATEQVFDTPMTDVSWTLPYDENGIPYLNEEDNSVPERVLAYENAMTPEIIAKKEAIEKAQGEAVLNEQPVQEAAPQQSIEEVTEFTQGMIDAINLFKEFFGYNENPSALNDLVYNFTQGQYDDVDKLTPSLTGVFINFVHEQVEKAKEEINYIIETETWLAGEGTMEQALDAIVSQGFGVEGMQYATAIHDGTVIWFAGYLKQYIASAYFDMYKQQYAPIEFCKLVREYLEDGEATVESITYENIVGFVDFIKGLSQAA